MRVAFRTDSSRQIGTGHLMRCLTLADELARRGHQSLFLCRELPGNIASLARERGHELEMLAAPPSGAQVDETAPAHAHWLGIPWECDATGTAEALTAHGGPVDWLIVDHYALDARWEERLAAQHLRLMAIDDLADRPHSCDLLVDQNLYPDPGRRYHGLVPKSCRMLLGPRYALLRPEFSEARRKLRNRDGEVRRVFVFFGGVDADNETLKALEALALTDAAGIEVDVAIGRPNPHRETLRRYCEARPNVRLYVQTQRVAELMAAADLAIGGGGVATWERCALGLPALVWPLAENQRLLIATAADRGVVLAADVFSAAADLAPLLATLIHSHHLCRHIGAVAAALCDGRGAGRVAEFIGPVVVRLRAATMADCKRMHEWRNDEDTRRFSADPRPIPYAAHCTWFERSLANPFRVLLVAERDGTPVGVLRFDLERTVATVSIYMVPGLSGKGLGATLIDAGEDWLRAYHPNTNRLHALILETNVPSQALFERCGFKRHHTVYEKAL